MVSDWLIRLVVSDWFIRSVDCDWLIRSVVSDWLTRSVVSRLTALLAERLTSDYRQSVATETDSGLTQNRALQLWFDTKWLMNMLPKQVKVSVTYQQTHDLQSSLLEIKSIQIS